MTEVDHFRAAERLLAEAEDTALDDPRRADLIAIAQVHATLAGAAAAVSAPRKSVTISGPFLRALVTLVDTGRGT